MIQKREAYSVTTFAHHGDCGGNSPDGYHHSCPPPPPATTKNPRPERHKCLRINGSSDIPLEILADHVAPFLDRRTYNSCGLLCRKARRILRASWWNTHNNTTLPPWPSKLVSRDHACRVHCLTFSEDHAQVACGCSDGKVRSWDVRTGELPLPYEGHWPEEPVVALAYSGDRKLLASASTDDTIRIWKVPAAENPDTRQPSKRDLAAAPDCLDCVLAKHVVSLHFSPDSTYLVSGHLQMANPLVDAVATPTIEIREVRSGLRLRRLEGGGIPIGFLPTPAGLPQQRQRPWCGSHREEEPEHEVEHQLVSTCGPNACLKLWSWNRTLVQKNHNDEEGENHNEFGTEEQQQEQPSAMSWFEESNSSSSMALESSNSDRESIVTPYKTVVDGGRCTHQWFLDRFNTVMPVPTAAPAATANRSRCSETHSFDPSDTGGTEGAGGGGGDSCEILVAVIHEPSKDSFSVWNTSSPKDRKVFRNASPYEIRFSPDGSKIASVDDFNTVKVWRISDGKLLKTFSGRDECYHQMRHHRKDRCPVHYSSRNNTETRSSDSDRDGSSSGSFHSIPYEEDDSDETSVSYADHDHEGGDHHHGGSGSSGLFPIHELVFSKDSSTVAVISRCYNEVHLFST